MKRILLVAVLHAALVSASWAQEESVSGSVETSAGVGGSFPIATFSDNAKTGFALGLHVGYYVNHFIAVGGDFGYYANNASDELNKKLSDDTGTTVEAEFDMLQLTAYGKFLLLPKKSVAPYAKAQLGYYWLRGKAKASLDDGSDVPVNCSPPGCPSVQEWVSDFGLGAGAGVHFRFWGIVGAFGDLIYNAVFTEGDTTQFVSLQGGIIVFLPSI
ncbi:MAG: porin family protein [Candidatus Latescibacterota bacterium]|nr:MAG: porin family protein [Candidatus Latescibacterota bacterium]